MGLLNTIVHLMLVSPKEERSQFLFWNDVPIISTENNFGTNTFHLSSFEIIFKCNDSFLNVLNLLLHTDILHQRGLFLFNIVSLFFSLETLAVGFGEMVLKERYKILY